MRQVNSQWYNLCTYHTTFSTKFLPFWINFCNTSNQIWNQFFQLYSTPSILYCWNIVQVFRMTTRHQKEYLSSFPVLLILASQRIETSIAEWFQNERIKEWLSTDVTVKRGSTPTLVECAILAWVAGNILGPKTCSGYFELIFIEFFELFFTFRINRIINFWIESNEFRTNPASEKFDSTL